MTFDMLCWCSIWKREMLSISKMAGKVSRIACKLFVCGYPQALLANLLHKTQPKKVMNIRRQSVFQNCNVTERYFNMNF